MYFTLYLVPILHIQHDNNLNNFAMDNTNIETVPSNGRHRPSKVIHNAYVIEPYGIEPHQERKLVMNVKSVGAIVVM